MYLCLDFGYLFESMFVEVFMVFDSLFKIDFLLCLIMEQFDCFVCLCVWNDMKVFVYYGIILMFEFVNFFVMSEKEQVVYWLIWVYYLVQFFFYYEFDCILVEFFCGQQKLVVMGK